MRAITSIYRFFEARLFNTFARKLLGCILPPLGFLVYLGYTLYQGSRAEEGLLLAAALDPVAKAAQLARLEWLRTLSLALPALAVLASIGTFLATLFSLKGPTRAVTQTFQSGDFSSDIMVISSDEIGRLTEGFNAFAARLRQILSESKVLGISIAVDSTRTSKLARESAEKSRRQGEVADCIYSASAEATQAVNDVARTTQDLSHSISENLARATSASQDLSLAREDIKSTSRSIQAFTDTINELHQKSERIQDVVGLIQDVSDQTQLLALNASIEAAHAGSAGAGFAVVAEEIRKLSTRVNEATEEISRTIDEVLLQVRQSAEEVSGINERVKHTETAIEGTAALFSAIMSDFQANNLKLANTASAIEELSRTNVEINHQVEEIHGLSKEMLDRMSDSQGLSTGMNRSTERLLEVVTRLKTGDSEIERVLGTVKEYRDLLQARIQSLADQGLNVFDQHYRPIPNTRPEKFLTEFTDAFTKELSPIQEEARKALSSNYAVVVDSKGYLPMHHLEVSKPLTGDYSQDLLSSRHQRRFFNVDAEVRRSQNTEAMLFQTYARDTGEILNDLSMPIWISGRHWGALVSGFRPERFLEK